MEEELSLRAGCALYLYAIVAARPDLEGIPLAGAKGVEGQPGLSWVSFRELAVAVSEVPLSVYSEENLALQTPQLAWVAPRAVRHEEVVRWLMQFRPVIPLKFATLCLSVERAREILSTRHDELVRLLDFLAGRQEWAVKVYVDQELTGRALEQADDSGRLLQQRIGSASAGQAYFLQKKRQKLLAERAGCLADELGQAIYQGLLACAVDGCRGRFRHPPPAPSDLPVLSAALLLEQQRVGALREKAGELEVRHQAYGLRIELSGPWAPYHFCGELSASSRARETGEGQP